MLRAVSRKKNSCVIRKLCTSHDKSRRNPTSSRNVKKGEKISELLSNSILEYRSNFPASLWGVSLWMGVPTRILPLTKNPHDRIRTPPLLYSLEFLRLRQEGFFPRHAWSVGEGSVCKYTKKVSKYDQCKDITMFVSVRRKWQVIFSLFGNSST